MLGFRTFLLILMFFLGSLDAGATVEYARETGKDCSYCHVNPAGGGELTPAGLAFRDELKIKGQYRPLSGAQKVIRFILGFLHIFTAILWFGTILYVHIVLKPAYAAGGLPKGELMVAWISMPVLAVTGVLLAIARIPDLNALYTTRFGILLMIKAGLFLIMVASAVAVTFFIGPRMRKRKKGPILPDLIKKGEFTPEELSSFNGKEGRPALIGFEGNVYDASGSRLWKGGEHLKKHFAGQDLTSALKGAPHGAERITVMPLLGKLLSKPAEKPGHIRIFYFLAYMNLSLVFLIIFIISLWRWW